MIGFILFLVTSTPAKTVPCNHRNVAILLDSLSDVGHLHNCRIEVVRADAESPYLDPTSGPRVTSYVVWAQDEFRCQRDLACPEIEIEFHLPLACDDATPKLKKGHHRFIYKIKNSDLQRAALFDFELSSTHQIRALRLSHYDLKNRQIIQEVRCVSSLFAYEEESP